MKNLQIQKKRVHLYYQNRGVEQLAARWAHNPKVRGSSPLPATREKKYLSCKRQILFLF